MGDVSLCWRGQTTAAEEEPETYTWLNLVVRSKVKKGGVVHTPHTQTHTHTENYQFIWQQRKKTYSIVSLSNS